jgi:DNA-binding transcriptional ArsR family regulator
VQASIESPIQLSIETPFVSFGDYFFWIIRYTPLDTHRYFHKHGNMKQIAVVVRALGALAQESRLEVFRILVKRGPDGYTPGELSEKLGVPSPTLSFHLKELQRAELVESRRDGRFIYYSANFDTMHGLVDFLTDHCCSLSDQTCDSKCKPTSAPKRKRQS